MSEVTLQLHRSGWRDIATFAVADPAAGVAGRCTLAYDFDAVTQAFPDKTGRALAPLYPMDYAPYTLQRWPAFLDDIRPAGAAGRWWVEALGLGHQPPQTHDFPLLRHGAIAPIGNLRVKDAVPEPNGPAQRFPVGDVADRAYAFLEHAASKGAAVGGATGAGGEAPKFLLRLDADESVWIDARQDQPQCPDQHVLVKFSRNERRTIDRDILRAEHAYYRTLADLGYETISTVGMALIEGANEPSLWLPRFDVQRDQSGAEVRLGMTSLYALIDAPAGSRQRHETYLRALVDVMGDTPEARTALVIEYVRRDLLNVVFGNSDNHGRNTAILREDGLTRLAPIYDFAPMKVDPAGIIRTTTWRDDESAGQVDWPGLSDRLGAVCDRDALFEALRECARALRDLPERLSASGMPHSLLEDPRLGLLATQAKLSQWGLL